MPAVPLIAQSYDNALALPYFEHLGAAGRAYALGRRLTVLHLYTLGVLHFLFGAALHTIPLHQLNSFPSLPGLA